MNIFDLLVSKNFLINFILSIIFVELSLIFFQKFFKVQISTKNNLAYLLINILCFIIGNLLENYLYSYSLMFITSFIFMVYKLKISVIEIVSYFSCVAILILNVAFGIFYLFSYHSFLEMIKSPLYNAILIISLIILEGIAYFILQRLKIDNLFTNSIHNNTNLIITISILNLLVVNVILYYLFEKLSQNILYILILDIYFYFSLATIIHMCHTTYIKQQINNLKLRNKTISNMHDETRTFKHDFHNILQAIGGYIITNDWEGLKKYYSQVSKDQTHANALHKLNPELINNPAIYNILADKYHLADSYNIIINLDVMLDLSNLNINIYELSRILGILLDNAIEASKECNEKNINISFKQDKYKKMLIIENTYNNKQICIDKIFEKDYTTKPHNTGLGLWEVKKILNKNSNLNLYTTKNNDYFSQQLEIYST